MKSYILLIFEELDKMTENIEKIHLLQKSNGD